MSNRLRNLKPPFKADTMGGYIFGADGFMVCQVRGWGRLQKQADGAECQDAHLQFIADALNEKCEREGIK